MILRLSTRLAKLPSVPPIHPIHIHIRSRSLWGFPTSTTTPRIFNTVRNEHELTTLISLPLGPTGRSPLLTFWTASFSSESETIGEQLQALLRGEIGGLGDEAYGIGYAEIESDAVTAAELAPRYMIDSIPTLMAFQGGMAQYETRVTEMGKLRDVEFLEGWIRDRAARR